MNTPAESFRPASTESGTFPLVAPQGTTRPVSDSAPSGSSSGESTGRQFSFIVLCEKSGRVREELRRMGIDAWSCDTEPAEDGSLFHLQMDAIECVRRGHPLTGRPWDRAIAHPPCTYLANSGVRWLYTKTGLDAIRWQKMKHGIRFFADLWNLLGDIPKAFENPIMHCHAAHLLCELAPSVFTNGKPQIIQPWMFGHPETKATGLYLHRLPRLKPTKVVYAEMIELPASVRNRVHYASPGPERASNRSRTLPGIAAAMAQQWGGTIP